MNEISPIDERSAEYAVSPIFLERWSPRAYDGQPMPEDKLLTVLEAAHWAPSAYNVQPWRFIYAIKGTPEFDRMLDLLVEFNQGWAKNAGALVFIVSKTHSAPPGAAEETPNYSHSFDAGSAWGLMSIQAQILGYHAHGMTGLKFDKIPETLNIPEGYRVEAAAAIGTQAAPDVLPEALRKNEVPSKRRPLDEVVFKGIFAAE